MRSSGKGALLVSEEEEEVIFFRDARSARYAVACDPIDGSSNLDAGVSVGTIFAVHKLAEGSRGTRADILKPGTELVAAGFTMYGASAQLVITMRGSTVNGFTLDASLGEFILTHPRMRIPPRQAIYSVNEGNAFYWEDRVKAYVDSLKAPQEGSGKPYSARYIGSMVADAYRTLLYGGIFAYPGDKKSPKGKLRILYECAPMAMVFENGECPAGRAAIGRAARVLTGSLVLFSSCSRRPGRQRRHEAHARGGARGHPRQVRHLHGQLRRGGEGQGVPRVAGGAVAAVARQHLGLGWRVLVKSYVDSASRAICIRDALFSGPTYAPRRPVDRPSCPVPPDSQAPRGDRRERLQLGWLQTFHHPVSHAGDMGYLVRASRGRSSSRSRWGP